MAGTILPQGAGYGIIIGFGALFALGMWWLAVLLARFQNEVQGSEMFMTAKRSVKTGLVASAVVSSWTIAATLLTSSTWAFEYGISGVCRPDPVIAMKTDERRHTFTVQVQRSRSSSFPSRRWN